MGGIAMHDLIVKGGFLVDPENSIRGIFDIGIEDGRVAEVSHEISPAEGKRTFFADGRIILPGIIDMHMHTGFTGEGGRAAMRMMVKAGTATALDCGGPLDGFFDFSGHDGVGMGMMCLQMLKPGWNVGGPNPGAGEISRRVDEVLDNGAIGIKILGGLYPLTPEATRLGIEEANKKKCLAAFHVGTTRNPRGNFNAFCEAVELAEGLSLDMVHVNAYCRGQVLGDALAETAQALAALEAHPNIFSESYLSVFSMTPSKCINGEFESNGPKNSLNMGGYEGNEKGLRKAIMDGFAAVVYPRGDENVRLSGEEGIRYLDEMKTEVTCAFRLSPASTRFLLATQKTKTGRFTVDALATDGGAMPRNFIVEKGTALVRMDMLSWEDYARKTSTNPARIIGLKNKGHLGIGADADISVLEGTSGKAYSVISGGKIIMVDGVITGSGTTVITTGRGKKAVGRRGFEPYIADIEQGWFYTGRPEK
jgi:hypothetical protein